jgi:hypothetical protein
MGEAKNKKQRFLAAHPRCCFCGGEERATTIDHVPPRTCFPDRIGPEGYEFPACDRCQRVSRFDELALGFFVQLVEPEESNYRKDQSAKALRGLINNLPHLVPDFDLPGPVKRRAYRDFDAEKPKGMFASELPVVGVPEEVHEYLLRYARKMACALFYREMGRAAPLDYDVWATWSQGQNRAHMAAWRKFAEMTPLISKGGRTNLNFGNKFGYRCNKKESPDLFAAIAQFGGGLAIAMVIVNPDSRRRMDHHDWVAVRDNYSS